MYCSTSTLAEIAMARILIVEDNAMIRDMLSRYLRLDDYEVIAAVDGQQAVAVAEAEQPDLIIMDMRLPVVDGWQATRQIKAIPQFRTTPIIALTAHAFAEERAQCAAAGCDEYEAKPIDFPRLLSKIRSLLSREAA
jgi:CheY-like chemotaxis protein